MRDRPLITTVYDCGARDGMHRAWRAYPGRIRYVGFEPEAEAFAALERSARERRDERVEQRWHPVCLSDVAASRTFRVYGGVPALSSFYELDRSATHRYGLLDTPLVSETTLRCDTVDGIAARDGDPPDFLSIDAQGASLDVVRGAEKSLASGLIGVRCEVEWLRLYREQPLFDDVWRHLRERDFELVRLEKCGSGAAGTSTDAGPFSESIDDARPAWADAIFLRSFRAIESSVEALAARCCKLVWFASANGCGSIGLELLLRLGDAGRLRGLAATLAEEDREALRSTARRHLDAAERSTWQTDDAYRSPYRALRDRLRARLDDAGL